MTGFACFKVYSLEFRVSYGVLSKESELVRAESSEFVGSTILVSVFRDSKRTKSEGLDRLGEVEHENLEYSCKIICEILEF